MSWRWASASVIGTAHLHLGQPLQDAYVVRLLSDGAIIAIVSDGAGSAKYGMYGAWITCRTLSSCCVEWFKSNEIAPGEDVIHGWIDALRDRIYAIANTRNGTPRDFAATLAAVLITSSGTVTIQIGDSAVVARTGETWEALCWPENGEYASTTFFVTDQPNAKININFLPDIYDSYAIFSDGVGDIALSYVEQEPFAPFLDAMSRPVQNSTDSGRLTELSDALGAYLAGPRVCERTDDDKTLILLARS